MIDLYETESNMLAFLLFQELSYKQQTAAPSDPVLVSVDGQQFSHFHQMQRQSPLRFDLKQIPLVSLPAGFMRAPGER